MAEAHPDDLAGSAFFLRVSWHALRNPRSHGFYRFIAWECMLALVLLNFPQWTVDPFSPRQIVSWVLLGTSVALALHGVRLLRAVGRPGAARDDAELFAFEKTSTLVTTVTTSTTTTTDETVTETTTETAEPETSTVTSTVTEPGGG